MKKTDIVVLLTVFIIIVVFIVSRINNKKKEHFSGLYSYNLLDLREDHGTGMFEGDDEVKVYNIDLTPTVGPAGAQQVGTRDESIPIVGFKPEEVRKIPNFEKAIKRKNNVEYVDNNLMVPLLYHVLKRVTILFESIQNQITDCCYK